MDDWRVQTRIFRIVSMARTTIRPRRLLSRPEKLWRLITVIALQINKTNKKYVI